MGARKLYQQEILKLLENATEPMLLQVIKQLKEAEESAPHNQPTPFDEAMHRIKSGFWKDKISPSEEFATKKAFEKQLDR
jgi:hypothetical protein